ncbi:hypothetical protein FACS1894163_06260 [Spirochaetia bacterium]|nr:hypothetical protein FACS1894163_06260 [Spirochaetia bacterium]
MKKTTQGYKTSLSLNDFDRIKVNISLNSDVYHIGYLSFSPINIQIEVTAEYESLQDAEIFKTEYDKIFCEGKRQSSNYYYTLFNLTVIELEYGLLHSINGRTYARALYNVECFLENEYYNSNDNKVNSIIIYSDILEKWLGNTFKQEEIVVDYLNGNLWKENKMFNRDEFSIEILDKTKLSVKYNITESFSTPEYFAGVIFPPFIEIDYFTHVNIEKVLNNIKDLSTIFSYLLGFKMDIHKIIIKQGVSLSSDIFFCYKQPLNIDEQIFFPYGRNQKSKLEDTPELPLEIFQTFFKMNDYEKHLFQRNIEAKEVSVIEEKFLLIFRLVEKKAVRDRKNTADELFRVYNKFSSFSGIDTSFDEEITKNMTRLRHDITHANEYYSTDKCIEFFIRILSLLSTYLYLKELNLSEESILKLIKRQNNKLRVAIHFRYYLLTYHPENGSDMKLSIRKNQ